MVDANALITLASRPSAGSGWIGVDYEGQFLAVGGPVMKLPKVEDQTFIQAQSDALKKGGFSPYMAHRPNMKPAIDAGHKIVYLTDKKNYRAELIFGDTILVAKRV
jgi:hypothetical protein